MIYKLLRSYLLQVFASVEMERRIMSKDFKTQQNDHYRIPGTYATNGNASAQFKAPVAPFPKAPETNTPAISLPGVHILHPAPADPHRREQVKYYANWLAKQAKHEVLN